MRLWLDSESSGQCLGVQLAFRDKQCPSGLCTGARTNIFISDIDSGKLTGGTKLSATLGTHGGWGGIQGDLEKLRRWAYGKIMRFNKARHKVLHLCQGNPCQGIQSRLRDEQNLGSLVEKDLGGLMDGKLDLIQLCALAAQKTIVF